MSKLENVRTKDVVVALDKERRLRFDLNAFAEIEDLYDSVEEGMKQMQAGSIKALRNLLWAGLVHEDDKLTVKQVGAMISVSDLPNLAVHINAALTGAYPDPTETIEENKSEGEVSPN